MNSVKFNAVKNLTTEIETTIMTSKSGKFTINGKDFTAKSVLTISTAKENAKLSKGTVSLADG